MCKFYKLAMRCNHTDTVPAPCEFRDSGIRDWRGKRYPCSKIIIAVEDFSRDCMRCTDEKVKKKEEVMVEDLVELYPSPTITTTKTMVTEDYQTRTPERQRAEERSNMQAIVRNEAFLRKRRRPGTLFIPGVCKSFNLLSELDIKHQLHINEEFLLRRERRRMLQAHFRTREGFQDYLEIQDRHLKAITVLDDSIASIYLRGMEVSSCGTRTDSELENGTAATVEVATPTGSAPNGLCELEKAIKEEAFTLTNWKDRSLAHRSMIISNHRDNLAQLEAVTRRVQERSTLKFQNANTTDTKGKGKGKGRQILDEKNNAGKRAIATQDAASDSKEDNDEDIYDPTHSTLDSYRRRVESSIQVQTIPREPMVLHPVDPEIGRQLWSKGELKEEENEEERIGEFKSLPLRIFDEPHIIPCSLRPTASLQDEEEPPRSESRLEIRPFDTFLQDFQTLNGHIVEKELEPDAEDNKSSPQAAEQCTSSQKISPYSPKGKEIISELQAYLCCPSSRSPAQLYRWRLNNQEVFHGMTYGTRQILSYRRTESRRGKKIDLRPANEYLRILHDDLWLRHKWFLESWESLNWNELFRRHFLGVDPELLPGLADSIPVSVFESDSDASDDGEGDEGDVDEVEEENSGEILGRTRTPSPPRSAVPVIPHYTLLEQITRARFLERSLPYSPTIPSSLRRNIIIVSASDIISVDIPLPDSDEEIATSSESEQDDNIEAPSPVSDLSIGDDSMTCFSYRSSQGARHLQTIKDLLKIPPSMTAQDISAWLEDNGSLIRDIREGRVALPILPPEEMPVCINAEAAAVAKNDLVRAIRELDWDEVDSYA